MLWVDCHQDLATFNVSIVKWELFFLVENLQNRHLTSKLWREMMSRFVKNILFAYTILSWSLILGNSSLGSLFASNLTNLDCRCCSRTMIMMMSSFISWKSSKRNLWCQLKITWQRMQQNQAMNQKHHQVSWVTESTDSVMNWQWQCISCSLSTLYFQSQCHFDNVIF